MLSWGTIHPVLAQKTLLKTWYIYCKCIIIIAESTDLFRNSATCNHRTFSEWYARSVEFIWFLHPGKQNRHSLYNVLRNYHGNPKGINILSIYLITR